MDDNGFSKVIDSDTTETYNIPDKYKRTRASAEIQERLTDGGTDSSPIMSEHALLNYDDISDHSPMAYGENRERNNQKIRKQYMFDDDDEDNVLTGTGLDNPSNMIKNRFNRFSRFGFLDPYNELVTGSREYLFFSKPDLHLLDPDDLSLNSELAGIPFFREAYAHYRYSLYSLQQTFNHTSYSADSTVGTGSNDVFNVNDKFMNVLTNQVSSTLDLPGITASELQNNQNLYGIMTTYREGTELSDCAADFSLEFRDTKYLDTYMIFKIYDEYIRSKYKYEVSPVNKNYIINKINPELFSIWKVIVDDTGRIVYWAKAIGVMPMGVPRDTMSNFEGNIKFTVSFKAQFIREMDPINLSELNHLTALSKDVTDAYLTQTWPVLARWNTTNTIYSKKPDETQTLTKNDIVNMMLSDAVTESQVRLYAQMQVGLITEDMLNELDSASQVRDDTYVPAAGTWVRYPYIGMSDTTAMRTNDQIAMSGTAENKFYRLVWF